MHTILNKAVMAITSAALIFAMAFTSLADNLATVPIGTIIPLRMDTYLSSRSSQIGDSFTASVINDVELDRRVIIPAGSRVEGHVTAVDGAERMSRAGTIAITFDKLVFPGGASMPIDGTLTSLDGEAREDLEEFGDDDKVEGGGQRRRAIVFIGAGAGVGAIIGAMTKGGKGAAVGAGVGAALGTIGVLLSKGEEAEVTPGTEFALRVERTFTFDTQAMGISIDHARRDDRYYGDDRPVYDQTYNADSTNGPSRAALNAPEAIRAAQTALKERGFYNGPISGQMTRPTRRALRRFQRVNRLDVSGTLDPRTALELGIDSVSGTSQQ